jgi:hypothetical protein
MISDKVTRHAKPIHAAIKVRLYIERLSHGLAEEESRHCVCSHGFSGNQMVENGKGDPQETRSLPTESRTESGILKNVTWPIFFLSVNNAQVTLVNLRSHPLFQVSSNGFRGSPVTITRVGTNDKYAAGWDSAFGGKRGSSKTSNSAVKTASAGKTAKTTKSSGKPKAVKKAAKVVAAKPVAKKAAKKAAPKKTSKKAGKGR